MGPFRWAIKRGSYVTESSSLPDFNIRLPCVDCRNCGIDGKTISAIMHHRSLKVKYKFLKKPTHRHYFINENDYHSRMKYQEP